MAPKDDCSRVSHLRPEHATARSYSDWRVCGWILGLPVITDKGPITAYAPISCGERRLSSMRFTSAPDDYAGGTSLNRPNISSCTPDAEGFAILAPRIVVDCARLVKGAGLCSDVRRHSSVGGFSRFDQLASRERAEQARHDLLRELASPPPLERGTSSARWVISPRGCRMRVPRRISRSHALILAGIKGITTQEEVRCSGHTFFIDIALPV